MASSSPFSLPTAPFFVEESSPFGPPSSRENEKRATAAAPTLDASEVESHETVVEVVVRWETDILHIEHLETTRAFTVGEENVDFVLPSDKLGMARAEIVAVRDGKTCAVILPGSQAKVRLSGRTIDLKDAVEEGVAKTSASVAGAYEVELVQGARITIARSGFEFEIASVNGGRKVAGKARGDRKAFVGQAISMGIHGAIAAAMFAFLPALASTEDVPMDQDSTYMMTLIQHAEEDRTREVEPSTSGEKPSDTSAAAPGGAEKQADGQKTGESTAKPSKKVQKLTVSTDEKERALDREAAIRDAQTFGMIDLIGTLNSPANDHPAAPWGSVASGPDASDHLGSMWGDELGSTYGWGGVDLAGIGDPSGGPFKGNYLGTIGTIGNTNGGCVGMLCNSGDPVGFLPGTHHATGPKAPKSGPVDVKGRIPAEVIQRVIRQSFGRFRGCYEAAVRTNPNLAGRVVVSFTIGRDGSVGMVNSGGSDLPDGGVVSCVAKNFYNLSFPAPEGGVVHVTYPIAFNPN